MSLTKFKPGQSGNPSGRPKGQPNKITKQLRATLKNLMANELENLPGLLSELEPKDRAELLVKLMRYCLPPVQPVSASAHEPLDFGLDL